MYTLEKIKDILKPIFEMNRVDRAIVFGSYAKGTNVNDSDIDILIDSNGKLVGFDFYGVLNKIVDALNIDVDLIEKQQLIKRSIIETEVINIGVIIYERT